MPDFPNFAYWYKNANLKGPDTKIVIGILSARENFHTRQSIRETWLHGAQEDVIYKFIVGKKGCEINPRNRKDVYSCDVLNFTYNSHEIQDNLNFPLLSLVKFHESNKELNTDNLHIVWNASVIIRHPVIVKRIGLLSAVELSEKPVTVQLYDEIREEVVLSTRFSVLDQGIIDGANTDFETYRFQPVSQVLLPKDYECTLRILSSENINIKQGPFGKLKSYSINNSGRTVELLPLDDKGFVMYEFENKLFIGNLILSVDDLEQLKMMQKNQALFDEEYKIVQEKVSHQLEEEKRKYDDILFVEVTDVYRNLPLKLLQFHQWVSMEMKTHFVMKTDDDCFVDIERILTMLDALSRANTGKIWLGNFRENWFVERFGKWAEKVFRSTEYPQFACGSGNIVSKDISDWLARNAGVLFPYQGEDTSMGIWLSAIGPRYWGSKKWLCDKECHDNPFVIPQLSVVEMRSFWESKQKCGNICGCL
jgi:beta-1,3-N-acetylgalactosaminyltransferase 2